MDYDASATRQYALVAWCARARCHCCDRCLPAQAGEQGQGLGSVVRACHGPHSPRWSRLGSWSYRSRLGSSLLVMAACCMTPSCTGRTERGASASGMACVA